MKSPVNKDERPQLEKQAPPPAQQQHTPSLPTPWRGRKVPLRALGVVVPLLSGFVGFLPFGMAILALFVAFSLRSRGASWWAFFLVPAAIVLSLFPPGMMIAMSLVGLVSGIFLRSWWSLAIVPLALSVGVLLLIPLEILLQGVGTWKELLTETLGMLLLFGALPAAVGAAIGTYYHQTLSPWLEQWLPR